MSVSTFEPGDDETCILLPHQHQWLWKENSFVEYRWADFRHHGDLIRGVHAEAFVPKRDMNGQDFLRVCLGIERSNHPPPAIKEGYRAVTAAERQARQEGQTGKRGLGSPRRELAPAGK